MNKRCAEWETSEITLAKELWGDGYSAAEISRTLKGKFSRSAVIGKLNRLGLREVDRPAKRYKPREKPLISVKEEVKETNFNPTHQRTEFNFMKKGNLYVHARGVGWTSVKELAWRGTKTQGENLVKKSREYKAKELHFEFICYGRPRYNPNSYNKD